MRLRVLVVAIAIAVCAASPAAVAGATSEIGAVRAEYKRTALLEYFGPAAKLCAQFTAADRHALAGFPSGKAKSCARGARNMMHLLRHCTSSNGFSPSQWRNGVRESMPLVKVRILSPKTARVTDPLLEHDTLVRTGHRWRFSRGWPPVEC